MLVNFTKQKMNDENGFFNKSTEAVNNFYFGIEKNFL